MDGAAHPIPHKPQPGQGVFDQPALGDRPARQHAVVCLRVMAHQRGVHDRDPPHRVTDGPARPGPVPGPDPGKPAGSLAHRGERPVERAYLGRAVARILAVPGQPAPRRAEPPVLAARREHRPALFTAPGVGHPVVSPPVGRKRAARGAAPVPRAELAAAGRTWLRAAATPAVPQETRPRGPGCTASAGRPRASAFAGRERPSPADPEGRGRQPGRRTQVYCRPARHTGIPHRFRTKSEPGRHRGRSRRSRSLLAFRGPALRTVSRFAAPEAGIVLPSHRVSHRGSGRRLGPSRARPAGPAEERPCVSSCDSCWSSSHWRGRWY